MVHFMNPDFLEEGMWRCGAEPMTTATILAWARVWNTPFYEYIPRFELTEFARRADIRVRFSGKYHNTYRAYNAFLFIDSHAQQRVTVVFGSVIFLIICYVLVPIHRTRICTWLTLRGNRKHAKLDFLLIALLSRKG